MTLAPLDQLSAEEIQQRLEKTQALLAEIKTLWPGLMQLTEKERKHHPGRLAFALAEPFRNVFSILAGSPQETDPKGILQRLRSLFHAALAEEDLGTDPNTFEADLMLRRQLRTEAEQQIAVEAETLARHFADDALYTGGIVSSVGITALDIVRAIVKKNDDFRSLLAPVLDLLSNMTKAARAALSKTPPPPPTTTDDQG